MSKYLCADCVYREQCDGEWTMRCSRYVPKEHKLTNEEWFCVLSTEEKARFLACEFTVACDDYAYSNNKETWNEKYWLEWLKQPHGGES